MNKTHKSLGGDRNYLYIAAVILIVHCIVWIYSGNSPFSYNPYNSYVLQAEAWRDGSFDLGREYEHLELAEYDYRYFVSFPQFPAVVYFLFVLPGLPVPQGLIALVFAIVGAMLCYAIAKRCNIPSVPALVLSLLMTCGSNMLFVSVNAWVWFIAQNMSFTLTIGAIYCAIRKKSFLCYLLWAFAIGCRPFQILYFPLLCMLLGRDEKDKKYLLQKPFKYSGAIIVGLFYMWLNYARFGNIFEFGHNYLPEFTGSPLGQFHIAYIPKNLYSLIRMPDFNLGGKISFPTFDGMNFIIASPVFLYAIYCYFIKSNNNKKIQSVALLTIVIQLLCFCMHKTMGGWQFGNRYTNDCLPAIFTIIALSNIKQKDYPAGLSLLTLYGLLINICGTVYFYLSA